MAKATGRPAVVACTSGTAAANHLPAVIEAREARVPLIVLTADRPPELRDTGAGQTIDQVKLFGDAVKLFSEVGVHEATPQTLRWIRALACRAVWTSLSGRPGPVHLNLPLREPLVLEEALPADEPGGGGRPDGRPGSCARRSAPTLRTAAGRSPRSSARRGAACSSSGAGSAPCAAPPSLADAAAAFSAATGWPVLADPLSGARRGDGAVAHYDALLRQPAFAAAAKPAAVILRAGDLPTSKPLREWLGSLDAIQVAVDPRGRLAGPGAGLRPRTRRGPGGAARRRGHRAGHRLRAGLRSRVARRLDRRRRPRRRRDRRHARRRPERAGARAQLAAELPADATLVVASSMPVRDLETFAAARDDAPRVLSNRGANGIDGTVATAYGVAARRAGPVVLLIGDVALAHDAGSLLTARRSGIPLTIVLARQRRRRHLRLPAGGDPDATRSRRTSPRRRGSTSRALAAAYGLHHLEVATLEELRAALAHGLGSDGTQLIHVRTVRAPRTSSCTARSGAPSAPRSARA